MVVVPKASTTFRTATIYCCTSIKLSNSRTSHKDYLDRGKTVHDKAESAFLLL